MQQRFIFWCHPWDLEDEGIDATLARLAGDIGVDTLSVTAVHPGIYQVRPRPLGDRWTFQSGAAAHFQPDAKRYGSSRIRPHAAAWMKNRNPLERIAKAAERERLRLRVRVSLLNGEELVERHAHAACVNLFGDPSRDRLCPSHPDVREYVAGLVEDLWTNYGLDAIELDGLDWGHDSRITISDDVHHDELLGQFSSWCFCASCRQRAAESSIDAEAVRLAAVDHWRQTANMENHSQSRDWETSEAHTLVSRYLNQHPATITSLIQLIRTRSPAALRYHLGPTSGTVGTGAARECGAWVQHCGGADAAKELQPDSAIGAPSNCDILIPLSRATIKDGPSLVALVHQLSQVGYAGIGFDSYGLTPEPCLDWVRQAVRYARREPGASS